MMGNIIEKLRNNSIIRKTVRPVYFFYIDILTGIRIRMDIRKLKKLPRAQKRIYLLGIPTAANMGDMTQYYLILAWLRKNYQGYDIVDFPSRSILYRDCLFLDILRDKLKPEDYIFFQSGYDTHDLGGEEDIMHKKVIPRFPNQRMVMMPQTVFFQSKERERQSSAAYSRNKGMLFLARDKVSYRSALRMFPDLKVVLYPDIVTTLIGRYHFSGEKKGVLLCQRADGEKFYRQADIDRLKDHLQKRTVVDLADTTISTPNIFVRRNVKKYLDRMLRQFSHYQVIITDRYHGTIFSLVAGTPVIVIKTTDHKVTTGLEWFEGVYDEHIYLAESLEEAEKKAIQWLENPPRKTIRPYFEEKYYAHLKKMIDECLCLE